MKINPTDDSDISTILGGVVVPTWYTHGGVGT